MEAKKIIKNKFGRLTIEPSFEKDKVTFFELLSNEQLEEGDFVFIEKIVSTRDTLKKDKRGVPIFVSKIFVRKARRIPAYRSGAINFIFGYEIEGTEEFLGELKLPKVEVFEKFERGEKIELPSQFEIFRKKMEKEASNFLLARKKAEEAIDNFLSHPPLDLTSLLKHGGEIVYKDILPDFGRVGLVKVQNKIFRVEDEYDFEQIENLIQKDIKRPFQVKRFFDVLGINTPSDKCFFHERIYLDFEAIYDSQQRYEYKYKELNVSNKKVADVQARYEAALQNIKVVEKVYNLGDDIVITFIPEVVKAEGKKGIDIEEGVGKKDATTYTSAFLEYSITVFWKLRIQGIFQEYKETLENAFNKK